MRKLLLLLSVLFVVSCEKDVVMYTLTTSANPTIGGTVSPTTKQYEEGESVSLIATPAAEYVFDKWTGAEGTEETTIVMSSDKTVVANFIKKKYTLTTAVEGEGTITEKVIKAGAATDYNSGTVVELTATPKDGWEFKKWTGDLTGSDNPVEITIDKAKTVKAVFEEQSPFYLDENGITIKARDWVTVGTTVEFGGVTYTVVDRDMLLKMARNDEDVTKVITTLVTNMTSMFSGVDVFNQDISSWDMSNVTNMTRMFQLAAKFNQDIGNWDVSKVKDMTSVFESATSFNQDIGSWNTSKAWDMHGMFTNATSFNQNIGNWDVSRVADINAMFWQATSFNQDIGSWDVSGIDKMESMFSEATSFNQDIGSWDVSGVDTMQRMFKDASSFNQDLTKWCVTNITTEPISFNKDSALTTANLPIWGTCPD
jgi:uncharacterized repeat protein (TIGR02543 family)